jgi:ribonuclease P protein component
MLAKNERLNRADFSKYFASGRRTHGKYLTTIHTPLPGFVGSVVVSKKVAKKAHDRNRIRRRLYSILREFKDKENFSGVYILVTKPAIMTLSKKEFKTMVSEEIALTRNKK